MSDYKGKSDLNFDDIKRKFGSNLLELRTKMQLTQDQLAGLIGSNQTTISQIESGVSDAKLTTIWRIVQALAVRHNAPVDVAKRLFQEKESDD